jgi:competence protein ComEA
MPEPNDAAVADTLDRPPPAPTWRDVVDLERLLGGRPPMPTIALVAVLLAVLAGIVWFLVRPGPAPPIEASLPMAGSAGGPGATASTAAPPSTAPVDLVVHAAGAVVSPGVHHLPGGSRVADLLGAAGGPTVDADLDRVNLAAPLADGAQIRFPRIGEPAPPPVDSAGGGDDSAATGPIDLNTATAEELESLPGIGPTIAAAIVEHRERNGAFRSVEDLLDVPGIGPARLDELRDAVTV